MISSDRQHRLDWLLDRLAMSTVRNPSHQNLWPRKIIPKSTKFAVISANLVSVRAKSAKYVTPFHLSHWLLQSNLLPNMWAQNLTYGSEPSGMRDFVCKIIICQRPAFVFKSWLVGDENTPYLPKREKKTTAKLKMGSAINRSMNEVKRNWVASVHRR